MWVFFATAVAAALAVFSGGVAEAKCVVAFDGDPGTEPVACLQLVSGHGKSVTVSNVSL